MCAEHSFRNIFAAFGVEVTESAPADFELNAVFFHKQSLKFFQAAGTGSGFFDCGSEKFFLCLENCFTWSEAVCQNLIVALFQFLLPPAFCTVFPVCDFLFCRGKQIYLMQMLPMAYIHKGLL